MKTHKSNCIELARCDGPSKISKHILVVDDEPDILKTIRRILEKADYIISTANTEKEALSIIETGHIDLVISDLNLGIEDGLNLLRKIHKQNSKIKTTLMTGSNIKFSKEKMKILGIDNFIKKPFENKELRKTVLEVFNK